MGWSLGDKITTLYILMTEDYSPRDKEGGFPPPKEKPPVKMIMM
jgi:hypothetical protein